MESVVFGIPLGGKLLLSAGLVLLLLIFTINLVISLWYLVVHVYNSSRYLISVLWSLTLMAVVLYVLHLRHPDLLEWNIKAWSAENFGSFAKVPTAWLESFGHAAFNFCEVFAKALHNVWTNYLRFVDDFWASLGPYRVQAMTGPGGDAPN